MRRCLIGVEPEEVSDFVAPHRPGFPISRLRVQLWLEVDAREMSHAPLTGEYFYDRFNRFAADLYPGRYDRREFCQELAELANEVLRWKAERRAILLAHNYQFPKFRKWPITSATRLD